MLSLSDIRAQFPALNTDFAFLENAGGSQVPTCVVDAIQRYMTQTYVQLGASYPASQAATKVVDDAHAFVNRFMNGERIGKVVLGPSTTQLITMLAECYSRSLEPDDEIVICQTAHEANAGPWAKLARFGIVPRSWKVDPTSGEASLENLKSVLNENTKLVAFPHVSNLLGQVVDIGEITKLAHQYGAKVVVDGVAYAPHRAIDVEAWGVDWYVYSTYKVFGPHMAALFGTRQAFSELEGPNHFFIPGAEAYKFELGGPNHEGCAGLLGLQEYLELHGPDSGKMPESLMQAGRLRSRETIESAWKAMESFENPLTERLCSYLANHPRVRIIGPTTGDRVGTVSFLHDTLSPPEIVAHTDAANIGIRWGHMYAYRLCQAMGIDVKTGVTRVSMVHYNTPEEIERLIRVLDAEL